ncbi:MAG: helix-turn-helix domain-containing protein [Verrucomicrobiota bacterium]
MSHNNLVQSVLRGMDIILEIGKSGKGLTLRELAQNLDLKTPTLHNLLRTLKTRGFVRQSSHAARYVLGQTLFDLAALNRESRLATEAEKAVRSLFAAMQQMATITFSEQTGGQIRIILRMSSDQPSMLQRPRNRILDPYASASALVLHAFGSDEDREIIQARDPFEEYAGPFARDFGKFRASLKQIRKQGYALNPVSYPNRLSAAAPVLGTATELQGIIGLSLTNPGIAQGKEAVEKKALARLLAAARKLSEVMGRNS